MYIYTHSRAYTCTNIPIFSITNSYIVKQINRFPDANEIKDLIQK